MNWEAILTLAIVVGVLWALAKNAAPADLIFIAAAAVLTTLSIASDRFPSPRQTAGSSPFDGSPRSRWGSGSVDSRA